MNDTMPSWLPSVLYVAGIVGSCIIAKRRGRWVAVALGLLIPIFGFLFALMLKKRCPHCREYMYPGAKICPHCGRNQSDGKVSVSR